MRRDQISIDRFDVANASFWLDQVALWLAEPDHAVQLAADLWRGRDTGPPLHLILGRAAAALRTGLTDPDPDSTDPGTDRHGGGSR